MNVAQRVALVLMIVFAGLSAASAFVPLPIRPDGSTCGPGSSSSSAFYVKLFPDAVTNGKFHPYDGAEFQAECQGIADTRLTLVAVSLISSLVIGIGVVWALGTGPPRRERGEA